MDAAAVAALRSDLGRAGFTVERLAELWGTVADAALGRGDRVAARRALDAGGRGGASDPAAVLARVFVLGYPAGEAEVARALPSLGLEGAEALELIARDGDGGIRPLVDLRPYAFLDSRGAGEWWIASDLGELATGAALRTDHVLGVGGASVTLSGLIMPGRVRTALDLGTGCGIQALHLAREADHVVATDISRRALDLAALNAALNGVDHIEFRLGSLFEPVAGERFERIVSNPPFVITPRSTGVPEVGVPRYVYRDGGAVGDDIVSGIVAALPDHLEPGGIAQLLGNWEDRGVRRGLDRVGAWVDAARLDAWVIERESVDTAHYAETWIRDGGTRPGTAGYEELVDLWLDDFASRDVTRIGFGYLTLRRPVGAAPTLRRLEAVDAPLGTAGSALGAHLASTLAAVDATADLTDEEFAALHLAVASDVTEERSHWPGAEDPSVIVLRQGGGFHREVRVGTALAAVVGACDGELTVAQILGAVASLLAVDEGELVAELMPELREFVVIGVLEVR